MSPDEPLGGAHAADAPRKARPGNVGPEDIRRPLTVVPYAVIVEGLLTAQHWQAWFEGITLSVVDGESTQLVGEFDQSALHGLLARIRDLGLVLVAVRRLPVSDDRPSGAGD